MLTPANTKAIGRAQQDDTTTAATAAATPPMLVISRRFTPSEMARAKGSFKADQAP